MATGLDRSDLIVKLPDTLYRHLGRRDSVRWSVVATVSLILVPILVFTGVLGTWLADSERKRLEQGAESQTRELVATIDRDIISIQNALMILGQSPHLQAENFQEFYSLARHVSEKLGFTLVVRDYRFNRQVLNTSLPWGGPLEAGIPAPLSKAAAEALRAGKLAVSDVFVGPLINQHVVAVIAPIIRNNELQYSIAAGVPLTHFAAILETINFHPDHLATVIDNGGIVVTRSKQHREFAGVRHQRL